MGPGVPDIFISDNREEKARAKLFADEIRYGATEDWLRQSAVLPDN